MQSLSILCALAVAFYAVPTESFLSPTDTVRAAPSAFTTTGTPPRACSISNNNIRLAAAVDDNDNDDDSKPDTDSAAVPAPESPKEFVPPPQPKRLDPLLASLTRTDPTAGTPTANTKRNTPTRNFPILGEVQMDQSLFLIVPAAAFAVLGVLSGVAVAFNSQDAFAEALANNPILQSAPSDPGDGCRGICSTQEQDLEGLRAFMTSLRK